MYKLLYKLNGENVYKSPWLNCVKTILEDCGFPVIWGSQVIPCNKECFKQQIKQRLFDQFRQKWAAEINQSSKCLNYRMFKDSYSCKTGMRGTVTCRPTVAYIEYMAVGIQ